MIKKFLPMIIAYLAGVFTSKMVKPKLDKVLNKNKGTDTVA